MSYLATFTLMGVGAIALALGYTATVARGATPAITATELTTADFGKLAYSDQGPVLVDFSASWCGPCRRLAPIIDELAADYAGKVKVFKVDVDSNKGLCADYGVNAYPTVALIFTDASGKRVYVTSVGFKSKADLKKWIDDTLKNGKGIEAPKPR